MLTVHFLGTGAALPGPGRDNTSLAIDDGADVTLVDTSGSPLKRLHDAGIPPDLLSRVIITHEHLDHTFGYASLLQGLWLAGRKAPLDVYAQAATWRVLDGLTELYRASRWNDVYPVRKHQIEPGERPFVTTDTISVRAGPGKHSVPSVGLRFETSAGSLVYSSDTSAPCDEIRELATGANALVHEATFVAGQEEQAARFGHSTSRQAAEVAVAAGVERLVLIHFTPSGPDDLAALQLGAAAAFGGPIEVPVDLDRLTLG
jgi:ribonuclease Z